MATSSNGKKNFFNPRTYAYVKEHIEAYAELIGFWRWYPDIMFDFLKPETGGISLDIDQRIYLRGLVRSNGVYGIYNRGFGKCASSDTLVYTEDGIKEIGSFFNYQNDGIETYYDLNFKVVNREGRLVQVNRGVYSGKKPTIKITTAKGFSLTGTYVHPILVITKEGILHYKKLSEIKPGEIACLNKEFLKLMDKAVGETLLNIQIKDKMQREYLNLLNYEYDLITTVEEAGVQDVYDIQVDDMHSFVGNGFINHNTMIEVMAGFAICMLYPTARYAVSAQTKENAASVVGEKVEELLRFYPALGNEIAQKKLSKNGAKVIFKNGSYLDILANAQTSKGQRRERLAIEESVLVDNFTFQDALEPIVTVPRKTVGKLSVVDPMENNGQIHFLSTAGYKGTSEYERFLKMIDEMAEGKGPMVLTSDWKLSTWFGRGKTVNQMRETKKKTPTNVFKQNYASQWVGAVTGAIVGYAQMMKIRILDHTYISRPNDNKEHEFYAGLDIARSENTSNNKSALSVVEVFRDARGIVSNIDLVYITLIPNNWSMTQQAIFVKKIYNNFKFRSIVVDGNGVGAGVVDELCKDNEEFGVIYPAWSVKNEQRKTDLPNAPKLIYNMKAGTGNNPDVITNFINYVESATLRITPPIREEELSFLTEDNLFTDFLPRKETEEFVSEVFNLRLVINGKNIKIEQVDSKVDKDRYSAVAYVLWYIKNFAETLEARTAFEVTDELKKAFGMLNNQPKQYTPFGNRFKRNPFGEFRNPFGGRR